MLNKTNLLNELQAEYQNWQALLDQIGPARMDWPGVAGDWSIKDVIAHITGWRRRTVGRLQALQQGQPEPPPPWPTDLQTDDEINGWIYQSRRDYSVSQVLDESHQVFQQLLAAIDSLPAAVLAQAHRLPWMAGHPFNAAEFFAHFHDEHEADMRTWLARVENQSSAGIFNVIHVSETIITAGQPTADQLRGVATEGVTTVINLAPHNSPRALDDEAGLVDGLGMHYINIPVDWAAPQPEDFARFEQAMGQLPPGKTLIHCAANFRVTAFYSLYAHKHLGWSEERAAALRAPIWAGSDYPAWEQFIAQMKQQISAA
ncbi:MAG: ClbS/DfsB family four-helix bundle protein [Anaerolineae bacterium]|nr:ClbS/DfsB family four-helix bundle protein [Anaerolineae bacterium]